MKDIIGRIHLYLANRKGDLYTFCKFYNYRLRIPYRVWKLRHKEKIDILFVISEVSMWKSESLYKEMLLHSRFNPILMPVSDVSNPKSKSQVIQYFNIKGYSYVDISGDDTIQSVLHPDIIFYQQAYPLYIDKKWFEENNRESLFCHINYSFRNTLTLNSINQPLQNLAWMVFMENDICAKEAASFMYNKGCNLVVTGLPFMDELMIDKSAYPDPWRTTKKRIIYAPHHSILPKDMVAWASILETGDAVLELAKKYNDSTEWIFKPHPFLENKLKQVWGVERTEKYYNEWRTMSNSQMADGDYISVFKHSDAMIHDCGSFLIEYMYTKNPVMFINSHRPEKVPINQLSIDSRSMHYQADTPEDIEKFILNVIIGKDPMKNARERFFKNYFIPPYGKTAVENIINAILGRAEYKSFI